MSLDPGVLRLIAITDSLRDGVDGLVRRACAATTGGATLIQLRLKDESPHMLVEVARALRLALPHIPVVVNARVDVALAAGAHGVHLGVDDLSPRVVRRITPAGFIIGASVGDESEIANTEGADYAGIGPVFGAGGRPDGGTSIGVDRFRLISALCRMPVVAIGGVTESTAGALMSAGASGVAVISALFASADPTQAARAIRSAQDAIGT